MFEQQLKILEANAFTDSVSRNRHLEAILNALDKGDDFGVKVLERILAICVRYLKEDASEAACLNILSKILNKYQSELPTSKLVSSVDAIFKFILTAASQNKGESLLTISFNILLTYPDNVLAELVSTCDSVYELFTLYFHMETPVEIRFKPIYLAHKMMNKLTPDKKATFVENGLAVWFSKVIPCAMNCFLTQTISEPMIVTLIELLEMLTKELATIDYVNNPQWQIVLENIRDSKAYPAQMKELFTNGSVLWHRIWIILIKLLKDQITMHKYGLKAPINSMLPIVKMGLQGDARNRCRAFQCWNVLIEIFSSEKYEKLLKKILNFLLAPLEVNNAKVEETALAKLDTWWHFIQRFETRVNDKILYPFLQFCFGRHVPKGDLLPGTISPAVKKNCVEAFVEMVGHVECEGCVSRPRLRNKLISTKVLLEHWGDWTHSLMMAIKASAEDDVGIGKQPIKCAWKSFLITIAEMLENNTKKDLINDLLTVAKLLAQESTCTSNSKLADIINDVLISSILAEPSLKQILNTDEFLNGPIHMIISILIDPAFAETCEKHSNRDVKSNLNLITENLVLDTKLTEQAIKWLIQDGTPNDQSLHLWNALAEALQFKHEYHQQKYDMLLWPVLNLQHFKNVDTAALTWNNTFCIMCLMTTKTVWLHMEFDRILLEYQNIGPTENLFILSVVLAVLKTKLITKSVGGLNNNIKVLRNVMCKYNDYNEVSLLFPILIDTMVFLSLAGLDPDKIRNIILIWKSVLNILNKHLERGDTTEDGINVKVMNAFEVLLKTESGKECKVLVLDELLQYRSLITTKPVPSSLDSMLKSVKTDKKIGQSVKAKATLEISEDHRKNDLECPKNNVSKTKEQYKNEFMTPVIENAKKGQMKKETSENVEEIAVTMSNWNCNPRKLTENQKKTLQRKREDIPALNQDLSQSQDEFKLKSWKTDSQDASTTNSRSASTLSNDNILIIYNMPGTDSIPKIIENLLSDTPKAPTDKNEIKETDIRKSESVSDHDQTKSSPSVKTPRMSLKDKLIEKSTVSKEGPHNLDLLNQTVTTNTSNTPITKCKETKNVLNSVRKKFGHSGIYLQKKIRISASQNGSQSSDKDATYKITSLRENNNDNLHKTLKEAIVLVKNIEIDTNKISKANVPIKNPKLVSDGKKYNTKANDISKSNLEDNDKCPQSETSIDKSLEKTQKPEQEIEALGCSTSTRNNITKRKHSDVTMFTTKKKSRIEKELVIDMVEGNPFLKLQSDKRLTRKCWSNTPKSIRKRRINDELIKSETDTKSTSKPKKVTSNSDTPKEKSRKNSKGMDKSSTTVTETQDISSDATQDLSEDVIESTQDITTTISVKSFKSCVNKPPGNAESVEKSAIETQDLVDNTREINTTADVIMSKFPANKTDAQEVVFDAQPTSSGDGIIVNDDEPVIDFNTECELRPGPDTLELANVDTQPTDPSQYANNTKVIEIGHNNIPGNKTNEQIESRIDESQQTSIGHDRTITLMDISQNEKTGTSAHTNDDDERKKDFLNNNSEISPIKSLSPIEPKSPRAGETSSDFLVMKLSRPVEINGEPLEMSNSPKIFTDAKISPDKRDVRSGGRAAQMSSQTIKHADRPDTEEPKKSSPVSTPARRILRIFHRTAVDSDNSDKNKHAENSAMFKKPLPTADRSPAGLILKRKLAGIADKATVSPANKRKLVTFHDPESTSMSVREHIEPRCGVPLPQEIKQLNAIELFEREFRRHSPIKYPKRHESLLKAKAIESDVTSSNKTPMSSLDQTPGVEVVKSSELNDSDPIFSDLIDCKDSIDNIASELSSPAMRPLLVKELEGKIDTIGDLARLTKLEVNRICIKAPKVEVAKKVLADYAARKNKIIEVVKEKEVVEPVTVLPVVATNDVGLQTHILGIETETQSSVILQKVSFTQTDELMALQTSTQTDESGSKSTEDFINTCLKDRKDFLQKLGEQLENVSKRKLAETLPVEDCTDLLVKKMTSVDARSVFNSVIQRACELHSNEVNGDKDLSFLQNYLCDKFDASNMILFCIQLMQKFYDKM